MSAEERNDLIPRNQRCLIQIIPDGELSTHKLGTNETMEQEHEEKPFLGKELI